MGRYFGITLANGVTIQDGEQVLFQGDPAMIVMTEKGLEIYAPKGPYGRWADKYPMHADKAAHLTEHVLAWGQAFDGSTRITVPPLTPNLDPSTHIDYDADMRSYERMYGAS